MKKIYEEILDAVKCAERDMIESPEVWEETIDGIPATVTGHTYGGVRFIDGGGENRKQRRRNRKLLQARMRTR